MLTIVRYVLLVGTLAVGSQYANATLVTIPLTGSPLSISITNPTGVTADDLELFWQSGTKLGSLTPGDFFGMVEVSQQGTVGTFTKGATGTGLGGGQSMRFAFAAGFAPGTEFNVVLSFLGPGPVTVNPTIAVCGAPSAPSIAQVCPVNGQAASPAPEPSSIALIALALSGLGLARRSREPRHR